jgi:repressor LexA
LIRILSRGKLVGMEPLSRRQLQILELIRQTVARRGYPPSVREIGEAVGLSSPSTVHSHLTALVRSGHLRRDPAKPRAIEVVEAQEPPEEGLSRAPTRDVPLLGRIAAGSPILAEEDIEEVFPLPAELVGNGPIFMLQVRGDSMLGAGIFDGDFVVVRRQADAVDGELVAVLVGDEEATVKRLRRRPGEVALLSANPSYPPMHFTDGVTVLGKVVAVLRRL